MSIPENVELEMWTPYKFKIKTNIEKPENLVFGFDREIRIFNGNEFEIEFDYHEFGFALFKENKMMSQQFMVEIKGTKFEVDIDGNLITRFKPNSINPESQINITLVSDNNDASSLTLENPAVIYWMGNQKVHKFLPISNNFSSVNLTQEKEFKLGVDKSAQFNYVVLLLPQVKDANGRELLAKEDKARMYILKYEQ